MRLRDLLIPPVPDHLSLSQAERDRYGLLAFQLWIRSWKGMLSFAVVLAACIAAFHLLDFVLAHYVNTNLSGFIAISVSALVFLLGMAFALRFGYESDLFWLLRMDGYNICPKCGHWLKGMDETSRYCPECGADQSPQ